MKWLEKNRRGTHVVQIPFVVFAGMLLTIAGGALLLWSIWREPDTRLRVKDAGELNALMPSIVGLTQGSLDGGNRVDLLQNGDQFFPAMLRDIAAARQSVHVETFIWWEGAVCDRIADALAAKARRGVEVRLLVDASGGRKMTERNRKLLVGSGVHVVDFHPFTVGNLGRINNRDHRKIAIIDGRVAFIGGFGFAKEWTGNAQDRHHWRDTGLRIEGPVVNRIQGAFAENWIEQSGEILAGDEYFPKTRAAGNVRGHLAYTSPTGSVSSVQILHYLAIASARKEVLIQNPYLLPDANAIEAIRNAVRRGVRVRIMVPATTATDSPVVQHASHHHFGTLLKAGAEVYEYQKTLLHQKVMVIDGVWSVIGSTNFDERSFHLNDEISIGVLDPGIAEGLRSAFDADLQFATQRKLDEWKDRPVGHRLIDGMAYLAHPQL